MRTTERLVLRPFREEDLEPWAALNATIYSMTAAAWSAKSGGRG